MIPIKQQIENEGFAVVPRCISEGTVAQLREAVDSHRHSTRNLLRHPVIRVFAASQQVKRLVAAVLGPDCFAVRGIYFNKNPHSNWKVAWHQDCVIAVAAKFDVPGWGPWSCKAGVVHVRPPAPLVQKMLAMRIHLDDCGPDNGPLRVIPGTHRLGFLSDEEIQSWPKETAATCAIQSGGALLMRPILLHASSVASHPSSRRVIHLEFAAEELPNELQWHDRVS